MEKIEKMYAYITCNEDSEGVMGINLGGSWLPLVGPDLARIKRFYPIANKISEQTNQSFRICSFDSRKDVTEEIEKDCDGV